MGILRTTILGLWLTALMAFAVAAGVFVGYACQAADEAWAAERYTAHTAVYVVKPGDTLWDIASRHAHLDQRADCFEDFYTRVRKANKSAYLQPGQKVNIPYFEKK